MNIKHILSITSVTLALIPAAHAYNSDVPYDITTTLVYPDGKPAADAAVIEDVVDSSTHEVTTTTFKPDSQGNVSIKLNPKQFRNGQLVMYAVSPTGMALVSWGSQFTQVDSTLQAFTSVRIHLVDSGGNPVPHARVGPSRFNVAGDNVENSWDENLPGPWSSTTDNNGYATLTQLPRGMNFQLGIHDDHFTLPHEATNIQLSNDAVTPDVTVQLNPAASISGTVVFGPTGKAVPGIQVAAYGTSYFTNTLPVITDKNGNYTISGLADDTYRVGVFQKRKNYTDWVTIPQGVVVSPAAHVNSINLALIHGAVITGKVTDKVTGKPVPDIRINAEVQQDSPILQGMIGVRTDPDGTYTLRLIPGKTVILARTYWDRANMKAQNLDTADGDAKTMDFQITAPILPAVVHGIVLAPSGKPAPNATVIGCDQGEDPQIVTTDSQGHFTLDNPGLEPGGLILAKSDGLCTKNAFTYAPDKPVTLQLAADGLCTIKGQINDSDGNPIANANVLLALCPTDTSRAVIDHAYSNAQGQYEFAQTFGNVKYLVFSQPSGHAHANSDPLQATAGQVLQFPPLVATIADAILGGTVVDSKGNPVANVQVFDHEMSSVESTTDKAGHFVLKGVARGKAYISAIAPNGEMGFQAVTSGRGDNVVYLQKNP